MHAEVRNNIDFCFDRLELSRAFFAPHRKLPRCHHIYRHVRHGMLVDVRSTGHGALNNDRVQVVAFCRLPCAHALQSKP